MTLLGDTINKPNKLSQISGNIFGVNLVGNLPADFRPYLESTPRFRGESAPQISLTFQEILTVPVERNEVWFEEHPGPSGTSRFALARSAKGLILTVDCLGRGRFQLGRTEIAIEWIPQGTGAAHYLFTHALPLWLEWQGRLVLHASAVALGNRSVAFLGDSGSGKSTLCAGLVELGCSFVADDGLALIEDKEGRWRSQLGPPLIRLWPSALERYLESSPTNLPRIHPNVDKRVLQVTQRQTAPAAPILSGIYILERHSSKSSGIDLAPCSASDSLVRLIEHSVAASPVVALGLQKSRLKQLSRMVGSINVRYLSCSGDLLKSRLLLDRITADID